MQRRSALGITHSVPFEKGKRRPAPELCARYVLEISPGQCAATVEVQGLPRTFKSLTLLVSDMATADGWIGQPARSALALAISAIFILGAADIGTIVPCTPAAERQLIALGWGNRKEIWTPLSEDAWLARLCHGGGELRGVRRSIVELDPISWWLTPEGIETRKTLAYLEKSVAFKNRPKPCATPRRGLMARFNQLFRWS